ncbi:sensor histidine kinase [Bordetella petrii]|uniref:sensor histidine kinase n=1 Tax=Bordetella petrii TaxID=94624 RepID=UPI001E2E75C7|nr:histidine kinase [Bordetella petrii]MCD0504961.1 histidine kinase [Bordetella petrii]
MVFSTAGRGLALGESAKAFWRAQIAGWVLLALVGFCIRSAVFGNVSAGFWLTLVLEPLAFAFTSAAALAHGRRAGKGDAPIVVLAWAVLLCVAAAALLALIAYGIHQYFSLGTIRLMPGNQYRLGFLYYMGIFSIWTLVYFGVAAELAARGERMSKMRAETRALRLELEHLQRQIEPHFLFNALNTIVAEIAERPAIAETMTRRLAEYLRYSLDRSGQGLCRLDEEIEAAESYLRIQALRFDARFEYRSQVDPAALDIRIPHMTLQGLVENAIKHGLRAGTAPFQINLSTRCEQDELIMEVDNPGTLDTPGDLATGGGGLGNLCRRLALRYPNRHHVSLRQQGDRVVAQVRLRGTAILL